ncbi:MAG TPA: glycogen debranching protein GlgX [Candidatus Binatus sp.]|uniref:glycogen debranching protein GlgX n=1 Tax=Candidatus Binatus sp. TaxID=2811406 RepID=UPI002B4936A8|nr:glycogen debranching protein GlgX [Candidatus Binatus sp.]HKN12158.1 glycogen debranching protein GlgX [Candidatus Binatus sp.]
MPKTRFEILPGAPYPLGATFDGAGANFAIFSEHATGATLCLFGGIGGNTEIARIPLAERTEHVWHAYVPGVRAGQRYGYRVSGPYDPPAGHRFNSAKLLLDPYAHTLDRIPRWHDSMMGYRSVTVGTAPLLDSRNSARAMSKCVVVDPAYDWEGDRKPAIPWSDLVIYEAHVKGMTAMHPEVPRKIRGRFAGLAEPAVIKHLTSLGVNAIELMPVHQTFPEHRLKKLGLTNYWGYDSIGNFAPDIRFASGSALGSSVTEFKSMVKAFHRAGIEVILDVVYNHTAEGNENGPTICFRGIDNASYYRLRADGSGRCEDYTGTGNSLDTTHPRVLQMVMESLRYWILEMHVDGFRFDLATTLARGPRGEFAGSPFFAAIAQDPVISAAKLIAEPWDVGDSGYRVGDFPVNWKEWNGKYRDGVRDYWRGANYSMGEFASRVTGSSDLYRADGRAPLASVNFVTSHDGFTLADLVSHNDKHNEANGEDNRDGDNNNHSWNCGVEGPTEDPAIRAVRERQKRNFLATLLLSQGVPMITAGDELGRSQRGNNNAYCQDNPISWIDWVSADATLIDFTRRLIQIRRAHPIFRRRRWFTGDPARGARRKDLEWFRPDGAEMTSADWGVGYAKTLGAFLNGNAMTERDGAGVKITDASFFLMFNSYREAMEFKLPPKKWGRQWTVVLDTGDATAPDRAQPHLFEERVHVAGHAMVVLRRVA